MRQLCRTAVEGRERPKERVSEGVGDVPHSATGRRGLSTAVRRCAVAPLESLHLAHAPMHPRKRADEQRTATLGRNSPPWSPRTKALVGYPKRLLRLYAAGDPCRALWPGGGPQLARPIACQALAARRCERLSASFGLASADFVRPIPQAELPRSAQHQARYAGKDRIAQTGLQGPLLLAAQEVDHV